MISPRHDTNRRARNEVEAFNQINQTSEDANWDQGRGKNGRVPSKHKSMFLETLIIALIGVATLVAITLGVI